MARRRREAAEQEVVRLLQKPSGMAWPSGSAKRQIMRPSPSSSAEDVVDHGQRARVAALDGAGLPALRALQPLPGPARPQRPARPGQDPSHTIAYSHTCHLRGLRLAVAKNVGGAHRSIRLRQPSQKAWPHTRMRGTTPSLRRTASQSVPTAGGSHDSKTPGPGPGPGAHGTACTSDVSDGRTHP